MNDKAHRRELKERYQQQAPEAGVYLIRGTRTNRVLLGASPNLASMRGKLDFARATGSISVLDRRLHDDARRHGIETFELEDHRPPRHHPHHDDSGDPDRSGHAGATLARPARSRHALLTPPRGRAA
jgi:hypothetical protein